jgi:Lon-like ATP-dependent protease
VRWWHCGKSKPISIKNVEWLKKKGLLPLKIDNPKLPKIARVLGATFGDGGIFANLNGIFLSSSEREAVEEFGKDLIDIFGKDIQKNNILREGGEYSHSWQLLNTNRKVVRFFQALGAPIGNKAEIELKIPQWLAFNKCAEDEFFGALFGGEIGIPKLYKGKCGLHTLDFSVVSKNELKANRLKYLEQIAQYLSSRGVESTSIYEGLHAEGKLIFRLMISVKLDNVIRFSEKIKIRYCTYKRKKLENAINELKQLKKQKFYELVNRGYGAEHAMKVLNLTPQLLYNILNEKS